MRRLYRNWLMQLWNPRSPVICCLQASEPGKLAVSFSPSLTASELGKLMVEFLVLVQKPRNQEHQCPRAGEDRCLSWSREREFTLPLPFLLYSGPH